MPRKTVFETALLVFLLPVLAVLSGCGKQEKAAITSLQQLSQPGTRLAIALDSPQEEQLARDFPEAEFIPYVDVFPSYVDVANGRIDAAVYGRKDMELAIQNGTRGVRLLDENYASNIIAVGVSPVTHIPGLLEKLNAFIAEKKADGTLEDMYNRWVVLDNDEMPNIPAAVNPSLTLRVGTTGTIMPYSYYKGTELAGYDIELARRFAAWLGAALEFGVYDFNGIIPAAQAGDIDCIMSNLYYTPEKDESIPFSDPLFEAEVAVMVRDTTQTGQGTAKAQYTSVDQLRGKKIGSATGTTYDEIVKRRLPDVTFSYFNTYSDMVTALKAGKIAAFACDEPVLKGILAENSEVAMLPEYLDTFEYGFIFGMDERGPELSEQFSEFIREIRDSGALSRMEEKWLNGHLDAAEMPDIRALDGKNGTLTLALDALNPPFEFMRGSECAGFEVELAVRFCESRGYALSIRNMDFVAVLTSVQTGKADFGASTISITEERKQSVRFSEPHYSGGTVLAVLKATEAMAADGPSFWDGIILSFEKTFLREERWRLFAQGVFTTLIITLASILTGTALGFLVFMLCRNGNRAANAITRCCLWLVQGMPMVVLLMILYYIIFGSIAINGILVAVIGFTVTFGASVFGLLKLGVGAVDVGQYEAAYALGYSNRHTFFKIILPQALPHVLPAYMGEIVGLIKATAVVGYIAVQDLTKMGDIVRSRTYEAFFPLIAVTVIYFALEGIIKLLIRRMTFRFDPRQRRPEDILKGVKPASR